MKRKIYYIFIMLLIAITLVGCGGGSNEPHTDKVKVDFNNLVVEYDGKVHSLEIEGKLPSGVYVTYENNEHTEPGEYNVIVYFHGDYEKYGLPKKLEATLIIEGEVSKAEVWFDSQNFVYDGKPHSIYVSGYIPEGITVKYNGNDQVEPGQYLVKAYLVGDIEKYGLPYELEAWMYIDVVDVSLIYKLGILMIILVVVEYFCNFYITYQGHVMGTYMERDIRNELFSHYQKLSFSFYDEQKTGQLMSRITNDIFSLTELYHHGPEDIVISTIKFVGAFIILSSINSSFIPTPRWATARQWLPCCLSAV